MRIRLMIGALLLTLCSPFACANNSIYSQLDKNQDGVISIKEAVSEPILLASFGDIDKNGDGKITQKEFSSSELAKKLAARF